MLFKPSIVTFIASSVLLIAPCSAQLEFNELFRNADPDFQVRVSTDRIHHVYEEGDELSLEIATSSPAYLHLFNVRPDGSVHRLIPADDGRPTYISEARTICFPEKGQSITAVAPFGAEQLWCIATDQPIDLNLENPTGPLKEFVDTLKQEGRPTAPEENSSILKAFVLAQTETPENREKMNWSGQAINVITIPKIAEQSSSDLNGPQRIFLGVSPDCSESSLESMAAMQEAYSRWGFESQALTGSAATRSGVERELKALAERTSPGDIICLHFVTSCMRVPCRENSRSETTLPEAHDVRSRRMDGLLMADSSADHPETLLTEERLAMRLSFLPERYILMSADLQTVHRGDDAAPVTEGTRFDVADHLVDDPLNMFVSLVRLAPPLASLSQAIEADTIGQVDQQVRDRLVLKILCQMLNNQECDSLLKVVNAVLNSPDCMDTPPHWTASVEAQTGLANVRIPNELNPAVAEIEAP